jgi:hypothetical protein
LYPSKPGRENVAQHILAASDSAARLKKQLDNGLAQIIYGKDDISAKRAKALEAHEEAEARSEKKRYPKKKEQNRVPPSDPSAF